MGLFVDKEGKEYVTGPWLSPYKESTSGEVHYHLIDVYNDGMCYGMGFVGVPKCHPLFGVDPDAVGDSYAGKLMNRERACYIAYSGFRKGHPILNDEYWWFVVKAFYDERPIIGVARLVKAIEKAAKKHRELESEGKNPNDYDPGPSIFGWVRSKFFPSRELYVK